MKKVGEKPLTQVELNRRYRESHNLVLFAVRVEGELVEMLAKKLAKNGKTQKWFVTEAIREYIADKESY